MLNENSTKSKTCMNLIRIIVKASLNWNLRVFGQHITTKKNYLADALSRYEMDRFWHDVKKDKLKMTKFADELPDEIWPVDQVWLD